MNNYLAAKAMQYIGKLSETKFADKYLSPGGSQSQLQKCVRAT